MFDARVRAVLGPTNTGKTHLAITRLLAHASGIIGFPLRLLARENYDRMVAAKGARHVALITGEEKIVPPEAKWFACTVEAMPLDRRAEFVAVDEIQLCADPDRGHVFTDRLLHARGLVETMFLGAETIRPLLQRLVPQAEIETRPRLSQLTHSGPAKLTRLPSRSAVVAFSAGEVYAIAEAIRRRRGGCAVVMGRLSPRTRNAQVALYQNREVDFLVATDAIGMGLNMDVDHVAFASLQKFDGRQSRMLSAQEAAQIAGRAGRGMRDGSFGVTGDCPPLPDEMVSKIENHQFEPLQALAWRNSDLDFSGLDALIESLNAPPPQPGLSRGNDATDYITLATLAREPEVRQLAGGSRARLQLLWEACQVPDFRKLADETHTQLCGRIFRHLAEDGRLPADWISGQIAGCASIEGDLDTLMARLASIRVWSYIAARADWLPDAAFFQAEARRAEDAVSDALHERLTARFVDRRAAHLMRRLDEPEEELLSAVTRLGEVVVEGHPVGTVKGFAFEPDTSATGEEERRLVLRAARRALRDEIPRRVTALEQAKDDAFALTPGHRITWTYHPGMNAPAGLGSTAEVARLRPGPEPLKPHIDVLHSEFLDGAQRERIRARLAAWLEALVKRELGGLEVVEAKAAEDGALRGPAYRLRETMGLAPGATEREVPADLRARLKAIGIRAGRYALYMPEVLKPRAMALRAQLWALRRGIEVPALPAGGLVSIPAPEAPAPRGAAAPPPAEAAPEAAAPAPAEAMPEAAAPTEASAEAAAPASDQAPEQTPEQSAEQAPGQTPAAEAAVPSDAQEPPAAAPRPSRPARPSAAPPPSASWPQGFAQAIGWVPAGPVLVRLDVAERVAGELGFLTRRAPAPLPADIASRLGVRGETLAPALEALGFRVLPATPLPEGMHGPPTPARVGVLRPERPHHHHRRPDQQRRGMAPAGAEGAGGAQQQRPPRRPDRQAAAEGAPAEAGAAPQQQRPPRREGGRPWQGGDRQRQGAGGGGGWRGERQGKGSGERQGGERQGGGWRGDQQRPPRREDLGDRPPRRQREEEPAVPRPDSPFAILATLKLRKA
jgi:ATP-dependent RNA helicase SUPV3L1/SUV3